MGATIFVGLAGLFAFMGVAVLATWADSQLKKSNKGIEDLGSNDIDLPNVKEEGAGTIDAGAQEILNGYDKIKENNDGNLFETISPNQIVREYDVSNPKDLAKLSWEEAKKIGLSKIQAGEIASVTTLYEMWEDAQRYNTPIPEGYEGVGQATTILNPTIADYNDLTNEKPYITDIPKEEENTIVIPNVGDNVESIPPNTNEEENKPTIPITPNTPDTPEIEDGTNDNIEAILDGIDTQAILDLINKNHADERAYADKIRKETQEREDNAYQRAVADMRKAGINPNLVNLVQSQSGGGIVQPTPKDYSLWQTEINKTLQMLQMEIENNFKGDQNDKDRLVKTITSIMGLIAIGARMK